MEPFELSARSLQPVRSSGPLADRWNSPTAMTHEEAAFRRSIEANPGDDLPRLIFADWLDERGDPRGEWIRLQIEGSAGRSTPAIEARLKELLRKLSEKWEKELPDFVRIVQFDGAGFIDALAMSAAAFVAHGQELVNRLAFRMLELSDAWEEADALELCPALAGIRELDLRANRLRSSEARAILSSPHLAQLEVLNLSYNPLDYRAIQVLAESEVFGRLRRLMASSANVGSLGMLALAQSQTVTSLEQVTVENADVGPVGIEALTARAGLPLLRRLDLRRNRYGARGIRALAARPIEGLEKLILSRSTISRQWEDAIESRYPAGVVELV